MAVGNKPQKYTVMPDLESQKSILSSLDEERADGLAIRDTKP